MAASIERDTWREMVTLSFGLIVIPLVLVATAIWCAGRVLVAILAFVLRRRLAYPELKVFALAPLAVAFVVYDRVFHGSARPRA